MKNIWNIFRRDFNRFRKNVIAWIVILGITVVPALYAWFNIAASWDPYENTSELKVAVASVDKGYKGELLPVTLNLGDNVLSALRENTQLDWRFTSRDKAVSGVKSGEYYAAIVIPKDFSQNMMSLFSSSVKNPDIIYYSNAKENAIAPKVTDEGASQVQSQVKKVFIQTITDTALSAMQAVSDTADAKGAQSIAAALTGNLEKTSAELNSASGTIHAFASMVKSTQQMLDTTSGFLKQSKQHSDGTLSSLDETKSAFSNMQGAIEGAAEGINRALNDSGSYYKQIADTIQNAVLTLTGNTSGTADTLKKLAEKTGSMIEASEGIRDAMTALGKEHPEIAPAVGQITGALNESIEVQTALRDRLSSAAASIENQSGDSTAFQDELNKLARQNAQSMDAVKTDYEQNVKGSLTGLFDAAANTKSSITELLKQLDVNSDGVFALSDSASFDLSQVKKTLDTSEALLKKAADRLSKTVGQLKKAQDNGDIKTLGNLIGGDKDSISTFLSSPVSLETKNIYPIQHYGSSMAPFYSTLAMWVGGIVLVAMLKVTVSAESLKGLNRVKNHQIYLGRYILFFIVGLMQSGLICLGDLYYLKIQCIHPFLFLLAGWITSIVYVNIIYTLTVSFGDIGKAICVVLLVMQVAGSGGTFPIEVAPEFFQKVYPLLPFTHSMAAMRECIGGMYGMTYYRELGILGVFLIASLMLGLVLRKPVIKLNEAFMEKLESTHLM